MNAIEIAEEIVQYALDRRLSLVDALNEIERHASEAWERELNDRT